jgi:Pyridoxamine 5'-phosphate oxidase
MSVPVAVADLGLHLAERGSSAYLSTVGDDGRPHLVAVALELDADTTMLRCDAGNRTADNVARRPLVSLLWPARTADDFSLIVDGDATVHGVGGDRRVVVTPTRAVLHRPALGAPAKAR